jgi:hypothetical protein
MKLFNFAIWITLAVGVAVAAQSAQAAGEVKKVCRADVKTKKEVCKNVKIHKKVDGTPVPVKKK